MRVSKADGSQVLDLQKDALIEAGITPDRIYEDLASGRFDDRPGLLSCLKAPQPKHKSSIIEPVSTEPAFNNNLQTSSSPP